MDKYEENTTSVIPHIILDKYEEDPTACLSLIDSIFKYTIMNSEIISTLMWDIQINDIYENEKRKVIKDSDYLLQEHENRCLVIIHNITKYWERLHRQIYIKKRLGLVPDVVDIGSDGSTDVLRTIFSDVGSYVTDGKKLESVVINNWELDDEYDNRFAGLDNEIVSGYEPTPIPIFSVGGFKIPDTFGMFKKVRGRPKSNVTTTSFTENYNFLKNYNGESNEDRLERERDEKLKKEREASKKGKTIKKVTLKVVPIKNLTSPPTHIRVPVINGKIIKCDPTALKVKEIMKSGLATSDHNSSVVSTPHTVSTTSTIKFNKTVEPVNFVVPVVPFVPVKSISIPPVHVNSSSNSSVNQGKNQSKKSGKKPKIIPVLTTQFTPRLKSLTPSTVNKCRGRPMGSCNKPKVIDPPLSPPQTFNFESIPQYSEAYPAYIPLHPLAQIEKEIKRPQMCVPLPKKLIVPRILLNNNSEIIGRVDFKEDKDKDEKPKKRGRPLGSTNIGPTKESDKNVIIHDKEIPFSDNPTNFEKYLIQYARKNRCISSSEWEHHVRKSFDELMKMYRKMSDEYLDKWEEKNKMAIKDCKVYLSNKIRSGELRHENYEEDEIMKSYFPLYMFEGYNGYDVDFTIRNVEQYILYDREREEAEPVRTYEEENNSIIYKLQKQKVENYLCTNDVVIDRSVSRRTRNGISENVGCERDVLNDILKVLGKPTISDVFSDKLIYSVPATPVKSEDEDSVYITMNVGGVSEVSEESIEDLVEELAAESCDGNKGIYDEIFGESESESINGSIYRNYIHDDIISNSGDCSESESNTNNSDVSIDIPHESPIILYSDNSSEDNHELNVIHDSDGVSESDENNLHNDDLDISNVVYNEDVNNSVDVPYVENVDDSHSYSDSNEDVVNVSINNVVNIPETSVIASRPNAYNNVFGDNINNVILPRLDPYSDEVVDYEYEYERRSERRHRDSDDSDNSDSNNEDERSDNESENWRSVSNRNMFSFFFNEMNIIGAGGLRHNSNTMLQEEERPVIVEQSDETSTEHKSCGFSSYKDFIDSNNIDPADEKNVDNYAPSGFSSYKDFTDANNVESADEEEVNDFTPTYGTSGFTSYKDFIDANNIEPDKEEVNNYTPSYGAVGYTSYKDFLDANNVINKIVNNNDVKISASKSTYNGSKYRSYKDFLN